MKLANTEEVEEKKMENRWEAIEFICKTNIRHLQFNDIQIVCGNELYTSIKSDQ